MRVKRRKLDEIIDSDTSFGVLYPEHIPYSVDDEPLVFLVDTIKVDNIIYGEGSVIGYVGNRVTDRFTITSIDNSNVYFYFNGHPRGDGNIFNVTRSTFHYAFQQGDFYHIKGGIEPQKRFPTHSFV
jgi:hypothetical protein